MNAQQQRWILHEVEGETHDLYIHTSINKRGNRPSCYPLPFHSPISFGRPLPGTVHHPTLNDDDDEQVMNQQHPHPQLG